MIRERSGSSAWGWNLLGDRWFLAGMVASILTGIIAGVLLYSAAPPPVSPQNDPPSASADYLAAEIDKRRRILAQLLAEIDPLERELREIRSRWAREGLARARSEESATTEDNRFLTDAKSRDAIYQALIARREAQFQANLVRKTTGRVEEIRNKLQLNDFEASSLSQAYLDHWGEFYRVSHDWYDETPQRQLEIANDYYERLVRAAQSSLTPEHFAEWKKQYGDYLYHGMTDMLYARIRAAEKKSAKGTGGK